MRRRKPPKEFRFAALWIVLLCFALAVTSYAADDVSETDSEKEMKEKDPMLNLGMQLGLNVAEAKFQTDYNNDAIVGFSAGLLFRYQLLGPLNLQPEVSYVQRGVSSTRFGDFASTRLNYLDFPVLATLNLTISGAGVVVLAGPKLSALLSANSDSTSTTVTTRDFKSFDAGYVLGVAVMLPFNDNDQFFVSARLEGGFLDIDSSDANEWRSKEVRAVAGLIF